MMPRVKVAEPGQPVEGATCKFDYEQDGVAREGFVARWQGRLFAYENRCRHLPLTLDYADNRFFATGGKQFVCQTHGAMFEPDTGLCVQGPCRGLSLFALPVAEDADGVWLEAADADVEGEPD